MRQQDREVKKRNETIAIIDKKGGVRDTPRTSKRSKMIIFSSE